MNVLLTTILVRSGVLTHIWDLVRHLKLFDIHVSVAVLKTPHIMATFKITESDLPHMLGPIAEVPFCFYRNRRELADFACQTNPDIIHAHSSLCFISSAEVATHTKKPLVLTLHGVKNWQSAYGRILTQAAQIIAIGPEVAHYAGNVNQTKIQVIRNGVDIEHFKPIDNHGNQNQLLQILWFGRVNTSESQGVLALDQAAAMLLREVSGVRMQAVGSISGEVLNTLLQLGWQDDVRVVLRQSHVVFGRGRALREAMACGNVGFLLGEGYGGRVQQEWFKDGLPSLSASVKHGYPKPDPKILLRDLLEVTGNREDLYHLQQEARDIAEKYFDTKIMVRDVVTVYEKCLAKGKRVRKKDEVKVKLHQQSRAGRFQKK